MYDYVLILRYIPAVALKRYVDSHIAMKEKNDQ